MMRGEGNRYRVLPAYVSLSLVMIGEPAVPALLAALRDRDETLRIVTAETLGEIGKPALPHLLAALRDKDPRVRDGAAAGLGQMGPEAKGAVGLLIEALKDSDPGVSDAAIRALGKIGPEAKSASEALRGFLKDRSAEVRYQAAKALTHITGDPTPLYALLQDPDPERRLWVADDLGRMGAREAIPALRAALNDKEWGSGGRRPWPGASPAGRGRRPRS